MAELPLILAGPILRRVEPRLVAVWVALSAPRSVLLAVYEGQQQAGTGGGVFTGGAPLERGAANTLRVGDRLHVGLVVAELKAPARQPLLPGRNYSYNVAFGAFAALPSPGSSEAAVLNPASVSPDADLRSLGLLANRPVAGRPHLALGYVEGELPGFALPPAALTDLRMLHGSCRRPAFVNVDDDGKHSYDGLAWVDDLIAGWRRGTPTTSQLDPNIRPHQLFMTGDQIYADDVAPEMLPMLNRLGNDLLGKVEPLPTRYPPKADEPSKEAYLSVPKQAGFATIKDFVATKRSGGKDPFEELKADRRVRAMADPCLERRLRVLYPATGDFALDPDVRGDPPRTWPADLVHFPAALRQPVMECETKFSSVDLANHLMSLGEYCAMYLAVWCNAAWPLRPDGRPDLPTLNQLAAEPPERPPPAPPDTPAQIWDLHCCFATSKSSEWVPRTDTPRLIKALEKEICGDPKNQSEQKDKNGDHNKRVNTLNAFFDSLPRVRRALANIPTYMVFDDHDVTDDWNISRAWRDQVHTTLLGRRILTSALVAYGLFQDWGNDPLRYRAGPYRTLLDLTVRLFPTGAAPAVPTVVTDELAKLFALNQPDPEPAPALKWHFSIDGPRHRVIALDTRTRRRFRSRYLPPGLLSPKALEEQLPDPEQAPLPGGVEVLIVLSQTPIAMPALATSVIVPLMGRAHEFTNRSTWRNLSGLEPDNEIWPGDDGSYDAVLRRLAAYRRVVVLSGEVHFGFSAQISYWKRGPKRVDLAPGLRADLDNRQITTALTAAFRDAGFPLSTRACVETRPGNEEWLVIDPPPARKMFLVRAEAGGLHAYEEEEPARLAQFTSSGLKNIKGDIAKLARMLGFAFALLDLTPAERLVWTDSTPAPLTPPAGGRFPPAVRDRLGNEPVTVPTGNWPPGTVVTAPPDSCWRLDMVRDERPEAAREEFVRTDPPPSFDTAQLTPSYAEIARRHAAHLESGKLRFGRGVVYQSNLGLVRFERAGPDLVACHDVYSHPPGRDEAKLTAAYRVALQRFGERRPQLRFDRPAGG